MNVDLTLVSHTNAGKTTLARTLLGRDVGEVRDLPHVTDLAEAHVLLELPGGEQLRLWDTPGFGDSARLLQRLRMDANPLGWLLRETWDRWRDRPFWCSQQAVRAARDTSDVILYLANSAEDPRDAGYLAPEMQILRWIGKPVIVLLNQVGPPRPAEIEREELERWRRHLEPFGVVAEVLALDAFARCWVHESVLLDAVGRVLPVDKRPGYAALASAWSRRNVQRFEAAMELLAGQLAKAAAEREPVAVVSVPVLQKLLQSVGLGRERSEQARDGAMAAMASRLDAQIVTVTDRLIRLYGLDGTATAAVLARLREHFAGSEPVGEGRAALWGSVLTGALTGLKADLAAGGLTFGAGLLVGGLIGGLTGAGVARGLNRLSGADEPVVWWSDEFLEMLTGSAVLRYLAVAHFGRGRGKWIEGEAPAYWRDEVAIAVGRESAALRAAFHEIRNKRATAPELQRGLARVTAAVLERLYPGQVPAGLVPPPS